jgi:protein-serine/threonine kinase
MHFVALQLPLPSISDANPWQVRIVIETDKYIGIVLEYASGGKLFDHILAHRCLKEKDACRLFAQLISGVAYIHAKKIVHRDLKLENLLLDRNRNVIISDFGFANRFEHRTDDLMQTSCGSPCYAAPELVISEGMYVGSAVDIWSCGVILYAMLAGYLPFDDDPANPDGDNINLLYKYIINTPLTFPDYISDDARDLLGKMLVPDPTQRALLSTIQDHRWLRAYRHFFERTVEEHEEEALIQHQVKREEYGRKLKLRSPPVEEDPVAAHHREHRQRRHQDRGERAVLADLSAPPSAFASPSDATSSAQAYGDSSMDVDSTGNAQRRAHAVSAIVMPTQRTRSHAPAHESMDIDLEAPSAKVMSLPADDAPPPKEKKKRAKTADRHTIQVEYDDPEAAAERAASSSRPPLPMPSSPAAADVFSGDEVVQPPVQQPKQQRQRMGSTPPAALAHAFDTSPKQEKASPAQKATPPKSAPVPIPAPAQAQAPAATVSSTPPVTSSPPVTIGPQRSASVRTTNGKTSRTRASLDRLGFGKMFGAGQQPETAPVPSAPAAVVPPMPQEVPPAPKRTESMSTRQPTEDESSNQDHSTSETAAVSSDTTAARSSKRMTLLNLVVGYASISTITRYALTMFILSQYDPNRAQGVLETIEAGHGEGCSSCQRNRAAHQRCTSCSSGPASRRGGTVWQRCIDKQGEEGHGLVPHAQCQPRAHVRTRATVLNSRQCPHDCREFRWFSLCRPAAHCHDTPRC